MTLLKSAAFALALLAPAAHAQEASPAAPSEMTDAERADFRAEVRAYLLENPEVLMEAIAVLESRDRANQAANDMTLAQTYRNELQNDGISWSGGNPEGDVVVVEFMDYHCGYCRRAFAEVEDLVNGDGNIRFVLKEFPILGPQSTLAAQFALAVKFVAGDDAYKLAHDSLMTLDGDFTESSLAQLGDALGLDSAAILAEMQSDRVAQTIADNLALGQAMSINGTPTFVMDDQMIRGYVPLEQMQQIVIGLRADG